VADTTTLQVRVGDITSVALDNNDSTILNVSNGDVTTIVGAPTTITLEKILTMSNAQPLDIARTPSAGVLELASRADHIHSAAGLLLDGGNY
jgi:hypothetical protein